MKGRDDARGVSGRIEPGRRERYMDRPGQLAPAAAGEGQLAVRRGEARGARCGADKNVSQTNCKPAAYGDGNSPVSRMTVAIVLLLAALFCRGLTFNFRAGICRLSAISLWQGSLQPMRAAGA
jgi:hypothetical protein